MNKYPGDGGSKILRNIGTHGILHDVTSQETPPPSEPRILISRNEVAIPIVPYVVSYSLFDSPFRDKTSASAGLAVPVETGAGVCGLAAEQKWGDVSKTLGIVSCWDAAKRRLVYCFWHTQCHSMWRWENVWSFGVMKCAEWTVHMIGAVLCQLHCCIISNASYIDSLNLHMYYHSDKPVYHTVNQFDLFFYPLLRHCKQRCKSQNLQVRHSVNQNPACGYAVRLI